MIGLAVGLAMAGRRIAGLDIPFQIGVQPRCVKAEYPLCTGGPKGLKGLRQRFHAALNLTS